VDDHRDRLELLRDQLSDALASAAETNPNMLPQLAAQYRATLADLAALPAVDGAVSKRDELKERRASRQSATEASPVAGSAKGKRGA
jgi:hypothetical protein